MAVDAISSSAVLGRVAARLAKHVDTVLAEIELSPAQYRVLGVLSEGPEGASRLAGRLAISRPSLTGVVDGLATRGLIDRRDDPTDRRRVALALTPSGSRALERADRALEVRIDEILGYATEEEAALARGGLEAWNRPLDADRKARSARL